MSEQKHNLPSDGRSVAEQCQAAGSFAHLLSLILKLLVPFYPRPVFLCLPHLFPSKNSIGRSLPLLLPLVLLTWGLFSVFSCSCVQTDKVIRGLQKQIGTPRKDLVYIVPTGNLPQTHSIWNFLRITL